MNEIIKRVLQFLGILIIFAVSIIIADNYISGLFAGILMVELFDIIDEM